MKANKLFKKLALSGVALGAAAVTLTATTYAWYTQNTEVTIGKVSGLTSATADTGSIYVSAATEYETTNWKGTQWSQPGSSAQPVAAGTMASGTITINPVSYTDATKTGDSGTKTAEAYLPLSGATHGTGDADGVRGTANYGSFSQANILQYRLRLRTATAGSVTPVYLSGFSLGLTQTDGSTAIAATSDLPTVIGIADAGGVQKDKAFGADLRKALKMTVTQYNLAASTAASTEKDTNGYLLTAAHQNVYNFTNYAGVTDTADLTSAQANALAYYNAVTGASLSAPSLPSETALKVDSYDADNPLLPTGSTESGDKALQFIEIPATGYVEVVFTFWLDGWDEYCFDCMRKQGFTCEMKFTTEASLAHVAE